MIVLVLGLMLFAPAAASAQDETGTDREKAEEYTPDTAAWETSPWMRDKTCRDHGGSFSIFAEHVVADSAWLARTFDPRIGYQEDAPGLKRGNPRVAEYNTKRQKMILAGYVELAQTIGPVPGGFCVDTMTKWAGAQPEVKPFGFVWGNEAAGREVAGGVFGLAKKCEVDPAYSDQDASAAKATCGGFYVSCDGAESQQQRKNCEEWNAFSDRYVKKALRVHKRAWDEYGALAGGKTKTRLKSPGEIFEDAVGYVAKSAMEQLTEWIVKGVTALWSTFTKIAVNYSTANLAGAGFTSVYNLIAGIALAVAFLGWIATLATAWKQGRIQFTLFGGFKAAVGVTLAGVGAVLMLQLADESTTSLLDAGEDIAGQADFTASLAKANPLVAVVVGLLIAVFLVFAIVFLVLHGALVLMWALMGSIAAAGQVHPASSGWLAKWAGRLTALAWSKFAMVGVMLLAQSLLVPQDGRESGVRQTVDVVHGLALAFLLVATPYLLWELVDFASDRFGGAAASGAPATQHASQRGMALAGATGGAVGTAVTTMMSSAGDLARRFTGGSTAGGGAGGSPVRGPGRPAPPPGGHDRAKPSERSTPTHRTPEAGGAAGRSPTRAGGGSGTVPPAANRGRVVASSPPPSPPPTSGPRRPGRPVD